MRSTYPLADRPQTYYTQQHSHLHLHVCMLPKSSKLSEIHQHAITSLHTTTVGYSIACSAASCYVLSRLLIVFGVIPPSSDLRVITLFLGHCRWYQLPNIAVAPLHGVKGESVLCGCGLRTSENERPHFSHSIYLVIESSTYVVVTVNGLTMC